MYLSRFGAEIMGACLQVSRAVAIHALIVNWGSESRALRYLQHQETGSMRPCHHTLLKCPVPYYLLHHVAPLQLRHDPHAAVAWVEFRCAACDVFTRAKYGVDVAILKVAHFDEILCLNFLAGTTLWIHTRHGKGKNYFALNCQPEGQARGEFLKS